MSDAKDLKKENRALRDLIVHAWVHSGYPDCGFRQMTTEQKKLYCRVVRVPFKERMNQLIEQRS